MLKPEQVTAFLSEARTWVGTKYHPGACVKGGGTDCVRFLAQAAANAGIVSEVEIRSGYSVVVPEGSEYTDRLLQYADEITELEAAPGDVLLAHTGVGWMHSAIIISWPDAVIHATEKRGVVITPGNEDILRGKPLRFFRLKG